MAPKSPLIMKKFVHISPVFFWRIRDNKKKCAGRICAFQKNKNTKLMEIKLTKKKE